MPRSAVIPIQPVFPSHFLFFPDSQVCSLPSVMHHSQVQGRRRQLDPKCGDLPARGQLPLPPPLQRHQHQPLRPHHHCGRRHRKRPVQAGGSESDFRWSVIVRSHLSGGLLRGRTPKGRGPCHRAFALVVPLFVLPHDTLPFQPIVTRPKVECSQPTTQKSIHLFVQRRRRQRVRDNVPGAGDPGREVYDAGNEARLHF